MIGCSGCSKITTSTDSKTISMVENVAQYDTKRYGNSNGNINNGGYIMSFDNNIFINDNFIPDEGYLYRYNLVNKQIIEIANDCNGSLNAYGGNLLYSSQNGIISCDLDGNKIEQYYDSPCSFIAYDDYIYLTDGKIYRINLKSKQVIALNENESHNLNIGNSKIYYTSQDNLSSDTIDEFEKIDIVGSFGEMYQMDLDGNNNRLLSDKIVFNMIYYENFLYYISYDDFHIKRINLDSFKTDNISPEPCLNFNIKDNIILCSNSYTISSLDLDGKIIESFGLDESPRDTMINLVDNYIFFRQFASNTIYMLDLSTSKTDIVVGDK